VATLDLCCIQAFLEALTERRAGLQGFGDAIIYCQTPFMTM